MPVSFSYIVPHLQKSVLTKLDFSDFSRLLQCSKYSESLSNIIAKPHPWNLKTLHIHSTKVCKNKKNELEFPIWQIVEEFPVKMEFESFSVWACSPTRQCEIFVNLIELLEEGKISTKIINFPEGLNKINPIDLNKLLMVSKFGKLTAWTVERVNLQLLPEIFKGWYHGIRSIDHLALEYNAEILNVENDDKIFSGMDYELIWSEDHHSKSIVSQTEIEKIYPFYAKRRFYALKREDIQLLVTIFDSGFHSELVKEASMAFKKLFKFYHT